MVTFQDMLNDKTGKLARDYLNKPSPKRIKINSMGCKLLDYTPSKKNGYIQLSVGGNKKGPVVHKVACFLANGPPPTPEHQASHLCGQATCCAEEHQTWDDVEANNRRKGCKGYIMINGVKYTTEECKCNPRCLTIVTAQSRVDP